MKVYTCSQARQSVSKVFNEAKSEDVPIRRRGGEAFLVSAERTKGSPFDVEGVKTAASTEGILHAVREVRRR